MSLQQISIFIENHVGSLAELTKIIKDEDINIRALSIADSSDYGIIRLIVNHPDIAAEKLRSKGFIVNISNVLGIRMNDVPGAFHEVISVLAKSDVMVEYGYAFVSPVSGKAYVIIGTSNIHNATRMFTRNNIELLDPAQVYS